MITYKDERKPELDKQILKATLERLKREAEDIPGLSGTKRLLDQMSHELEAADVTGATLQEMAGKLHVLEENMRLQAQKRAKERQREEETPVERAGRVFSGEMDL